MSFCVTGKRAVAAAALKPGDKTILGTVVATLTVGKPGGVRCIKIWFRHSSMRIDTCVFPASTTIGVTSVY